MAKKSGKMALYEAIGESRGKLIDGQEPVILRKGGKPRKESFAKQYLSGLNLADSWVKIVGFVVILAILVILAFALKGFISKGDSVAQVQQESSANAQNTNQSSGFLSKIGFSKEEEVAEEPVKPIKYEPIKPVKPGQTQSSVDESIKKVAKEYSPPQTGRNAIVITRYMVKNDLVPVQKYFKKHGIDLEIIQKGKNYLLISAKRYTGGFATVGSEAYSDLKAIKKVGAGYSAPAGYEPFGSKPFQDAYGMKLK